MAQTNSPMPKSRLGRTIRRRLIAVILLTSVAVLALTCVALFSYELITARRSVAQDLSTLAKIIATNSTAALAFDNRADAQEVLAALKAEPDIVAAALYDQDGKLFAHFPANLASEELPATPGAIGTAYFSQGHARTFQPVVQGKNVRLGTLFLMADMAKLKERLRVYALAIILVMAFAVAVAYVMGRALQRSISEPILALAETADVVSHHHDYTVRAPARTFGELRQLTDAFNHMLTRIQEQTRLLSASEARHRLLFESSPLPMWVYDLETQRFLAVNAAATQSYGYSREDFSHMTIEQIRVSEHVVALRDEPDGAGPSAGMRSVRVWKHRKQDGTIIDVEITSHDLAFDGRPGRLVLANDITARLAAEQEIRRLNEHLEDRIRERTAQWELANKELESFSYSISHDLRAPLRHVQGYVSMLNRSAEGQLSDKSRRHLKIISDAAMEMGQLIDDLLEFSRMGRKEMTSGVVALDQLVHEQVERATAAATGREVIWKITPLPPARGDAAMLRQVFANLIGNALKYSRQRSPAVIEIGSTDEPNGMVTVFVRDNGAGFDMKFAGKLFGVFQRLHHSDQFEGTGIGLATVQRIVARHGGRVWAEAAVDVGATFFLTLRKANAPTIETTETT